MSAVNPYWEPSELPEGTVRVTYHGPGGLITINDYRGWKVMMKAGDSVIVTEESWKNLENRELPGWRPGRWTKDG